MTNCSREEQRKNVVLPLMDLKLLETQVISKDVLWLESHQKNSYDILVVEDFLRLISQKDHHYRKDNNLIKLQKLPSI